MTKHVKTVGWVVLAAVAVVGVLLWANAARTPKEMTEEDLAAAAERGGYRLMNIAELGERYTRNPSDIFLVDTRREWEYRTGWIKGALNFPIEPNWWSRWRSRGALEAVLGPDKHRLIVFY